MPLSDKIWDQVPTPHDSLFQKWMGNPLVMIGVAIAAAVGVSIVIYPKMIGWIIMAGVTIVILWKEFKR